MTSSLAACAANMPTRLPGSPLASVAFAALPDPQRGHWIHRPNAARIASFDKVGVRHLQRRRLLSYYNH